MSALHMPPFPEMGWSKVKSGDCEVASRLIQTLSYVLQSIQSISVFLPADFVLLFFVFNCFSMWVGKKNTIYRVLPKTHLLICCKEQRAGGRETQNETEEDDSVRSSGFT